MLMPVMQIRPMRMAVFHLSVSMLVSMATDCLFPLRMVMFVMLVRVEMGMNMRHRIVVMHVAVGLPEQQVN